jgi:hypothetical protein
VENNQWLFTLKNGIDCVSESENDLAARGSARQQHAPAGHLHEREAADQQKAAHMDAALMALLLSSVSAERQRPIGTVP